MAMMSNATCNNISAIYCQSVLLVEETRVLGENHRLEPWAMFELTPLMVMCNDCTGSWKWTTIRSRLRHHIFIAICLDTLLDV